MDFKFEETDIPTAAQKEDNPFMDVVTTLVKTDSKRAMKFTAAVPDGDHRDLKYWVDKYRRQIAAAGTDNPIKPVTVKCPPVEVNDKDKSVELTFWSMGYKVTRAAKTDDTADNKAA